MTWAIYNPVTMDVLRIDRSQSPPQEEAYVALTEPMSWPALSKGKALRIVAGAPVVVDVRTTEQAAADAVAAATTKRLALLAGTDWMVVRALETGSTLAAEWAAWRQALRDIPAQPGYPLNIVWPVRPEGV